MSPKPRQRSIKEENIFTLTMRLYRLHQSIRWYKRKSAPVQVVITEGNYVPEEIERSYYNRATGEEPEILVSENSQVAFGYLNFEMRMSDLNRLAREIYYGQKFTSTKKVQRIVHTVAERSFPEKNPNRFPDRRVSVIHKTFI